MLPLKERVQAFDQQIEAAKSAQEKASQGQTHVQQQLDYWNPELTKIQDAPTEATGKLTQATEATSQYLKTRGVEQASQQPNVEVYNAGAIQILESCSKAARAKEIRAELDQILNEDIGSRAASVEQQALPDDEEMAVCEHGLPLLYFEII